MSIVPRGTLRVEALRLHLGLFGIKVERYCAIPMPPPQHAWIKDLTLLCSRPGTMRARVYVEALCEGFDGLPCAVLLKSAVAQPYRDDGLNRMEETQVLL